MSVQEFCAAESPEDTAQTGGGVPPASPPIFLPAATTLVGAGSRTPVESLPFWLMVNAGVIRLHRLDDLLVWQLRGDGCSWDYIAQRVVAQRQERGRVAYRKAQARWAKHKRMGCPNGQSKNQQPRG